MHAHDEQEMKVLADWYDRAAKAGFVFLRLKGGKNSPPPKGWNKQPVEEWGKVSRNPKQAVAWLKKGYNVGIGCGDGTCIVDCDTSDAEMAVAGYIDDDLAEQAQAAGRWSEVEQVKVKGPHKGQVLHVLDVEESCLRAFTPRGCQYFFHGPRAGVLPQTQGAKGIPGTDTRAAWKGYGMGPGSCRDLASYEGKPSLPDGDEPWYYRPGPDRAGPADIPASLVDALFPPGPLAAPKAPAKQEGGGGRGGKREGKGGGDRPQSAHAAMVQRTARAALRGEEVDEQAEADLLLADGRNERTPGQARAEVRRAVKGAQGKVADGTWTKAGEGGRKGQEGRTDEPSRDDVLTWAKHGAMGLGHANEQGDRYAPVPEDPGKQEGFVLPDPDDPLIAPMNEWGLDCVLAFVHVRIRQNNRGGKRIQWRNGRRTDHRWQTIEDDGIDKTIELMARKARAAKRNSRGEEYLVPWRISPDQFLRWSRARCFDHRRVDPFLEWARGCREQADGPPLEQWMNDVFDVPRSDYNDWHSAYPWMRMAELAERPGMLRSLLPLWVMSSGKNKSTVLGHMLPPEEHEWFAEAVDLMAPNKERLESITGAVLAEVADMSPFMSAQVLAKAKAFITRKNDRGTRRAYARTEANEPRLVCLIATSDRQGDAIPNDPAGVRRFPPLVMPKQPAAAPPHMTEQEVEEYFTKWREHFTAQALRRVREGERAALPSALYHEATSAAHGQRSRDHLVEDYVMALNPKFAYRMADLVERFGFVEIKDNLATALGPKVGRGDQRQAATRRIADALTLFGWTPRRTRMLGARAVWWISPDAPRDETGAIQVRPAPQTNAGKVEAEREPDDRTEREESGDG